MLKEGAILKMKVEFKPLIEYLLPVGNELIPMNTIIGKELYIEFQGRVFCIKCGRGIKKSYFQGYCYPCFISAPETAECILKPELCQAHNGISRDMEWSKKNCLQDHFVYLSVSSGLKVGVTRASQVPVRWIDQGAVQALKIARTPNRNFAGRIEVFLKKFFADKTNWRNMLVNKIPEEIDLLEKKKYISELLPPEFTPYLIDDEEITEIVYPVEKYPVKVTSINLDKINQIKGNLTGIKGQYLIFDDGRVLNIRKHNGYYISLDY